MGLITHRFFMPVKLPSVYILIYKYESNVPSRLFFIATGLDNRVLYRDKKQELV